MLKQSFEEDYTQRFKEGNIVRLRHSWTGGVGVWRESR